MKLDNECIRDLLLYLEENCSYKNDITLNELKLEKYTTEEIVYTGEKLYEAGYINCLKSKSLYEEMPIIVVMSLTYNGHRFIDNIRDDKVWGKTKGILSKVKSASLDIICNVAAQVITNIIKDNMGNP